MPLIRSKLGPADTTIMGTVYHFQRDRAGRYVARVHNARHASLLVSAGTYEEAEELDFQPPEPEAASDPQPTGDLDSDLPDLDAELRDRINAAQMPAFVPPGADGVVTLAAAWPPEIAIPDTALLNERPDFIAVTPDAGLSITVGNAAATYSFAGSVEGVNLYTLDEDSEWTDPAPPKGEPPTPQPEPKRTARPVK